MVLNAGFDSRYNLFVQEKATLKIPFDSVVLAAVIDELQEYVGGKLQGVRQPDDHTVILEIYHLGKEAALLISCHPIFARAHFVTRRLKNPPTPPVLCATIRARLEGSFIQEIRQVNDDRVVEIVFDTLKGEHVLVAELMGRHSNIILVDECQRMVAAAKWVPKDKSVRPILSGQPYQSPPVLHKKGDGPSSPFFKKLQEAGGGTGAFSAFLSPGHGAYPFSVGAVGFEEFARASISVALEQHFNLAIPEHEADTLRASLLSQLDRVIAAREVALDGLRNAEDAEAKAGRYQRYGELILAYGPAAPAGLAQLQAWDYDGSEVSIAIDPELGFKDNANRFFEKAKKAKSGIGLVRDQLGRISADYQALLSFRETLVLEKRFDKLREYQEEARSRKWLHKQSSSGKVKEDRPYEGHRIRELMAPGGYTVLYGENSESNDYLTLRVAKPNDLWLHVRGSTSAHVVIQTLNKPDKVGKEPLLFAAKVAVQNSPSKHSGYVPVDYTLRKYVRKPKGSPKGTALYTHEKTLHIES